MLEIEINEQRLDLEENTNAVFNFDFSDIEDFSKAGGAYSYTINLPKTPQNDKLLGFARRLDVFANVQSISAIVRVFGVEIDNEAKVRISSYEGKSYNINLLLNISNLSTQIANKTLQDLQTLGSVNYRYANQNYTNHNANFVNFVGGRLSDKSFDTLYGLGYAQEVWWRNFYSAKMLYLFEKIFEETTFQLDTNFPLSFQNLENLYLHTTIEKTNVEAEQELDRIDRFVDFTLNADLGVIPLSQFLSTSDYSGVGAGVAYSNLSTPNEILYYETDPDFSYSVDIFVEKLEGRQEVFFEIGFASNLNDIENTFVVLRTIRLELSESVVTKNVGFTFSGNVPNNRIFFRFRRFNVFSPPLPILKAGMKITLEPTNYVPEIKYNWDYAKNLPAIPQKDFVKSLLLLSGCVLSVDAFLKKAKILSIKEILENDAIDITEFIDFTDEGAIDFLPKIAQTNKYKFKNTDKGAYAYQINNPDLPETRDIAIPFARYENETLYERYALVSIRAVKAKQAFNNAIENYNGGLREHIQRHVAETETDYKQVDAFFGKNNKSMFHPDFGGNQFSIFATPQNVANLSYSFFDTITLNNNDLRGQQCLKNIEDVLNLDYADDIYKNYKKVRFKAIVPIRFLLQAEISTPVFVGANINQKFLLSSIRNWVSPNKLCEIELVRININS